MTGPGSTNRRGTPDSVQAMFDPEPDATEPGPARPPEDYLRILSESERLLDNVDQALTRIRAGTYRTCEACGGTIDEARIMADPAGRRCAEHAALAVTEE